MGVLLRGLAALVLVLAVVIGGAAAWFYFGVLDRDPDRGAPPPRAEIVAVESESAAIAEARARFEAFRDAQHFPSLSIAVARAGGVIWSEAIGYADIETREAANPDTQYAIGSVSKPIAAALAMRLVALGALDLDRAASDYLPDLPAHYAGVTTRQLLSHQAGVRHYAGGSAPYTGETWLNKPFADQQEALSIFIDDPLLFAPDQGFSYSTYGYTLASRVMEAAGGADFLTLLAEHVTGPLGLAATEADRKSPPPERRTTDYVRVGAAGLAPTPPVDSSYKWAGGGLVSTPSDLVRFALAVADGDFLSDAAFAEMTAPRLLPGGEENPQRYGLGWRAIDIETAGGRVPAVDHGGTAVGAQCILLLAPEPLLAVAFCGNANIGGSGPLREEAKAIAGLFLAGPPQPAP